MSSDEHVDKRLRVCSDSFDFYDGLQLPISEITESVGIDGFQFDADLSFLDERVEESDRPVHVDGNSACGDFMWDMEGLELPIFQPASADRVSPITFDGEFSQMGSPFDLWISEDGSVDHGSSGTGPVVVRDASQSSGGVGVVRDSDVVPAVPADADAYLGELGDDVPNTTSANFRLQGKCFHLTYRGHILPERIFGLFGGKERFEYYSIVHEHGHAGTDYAHTHVYCRFYSRISREGPRCLDIEGVHPHIKKITTKLHEGRIYHKYHRGIKGGQTFPPVSIWQSEKGPADPDLSTNRDRISEMLHRGSLLDAALGFGVEIRTIGDLKALREERKPAEPAEANYPRDAFSLQIVWSHSWGGRIVDTCSVFLYGGAGLGKTECAVAHFDRPLLVRSLDQARDFNEHRYDGIVFDDCSIVNLSAEERINLVDFTYITTIKCRYSNGVLPKGTKRIFTSNKTPEEYFRFGTHMTDAQFDAIKRRVKFIHVVTPTFN